MKKGHKTLDIGCGWGGLGIYLAKHLEANLTGVTLSQEQFGIANKRAFEEGLTGQAQIHLSGLSNHRRELRPRSCPLACSNMSVSGISRNISSIRTAFEEGRCIPPAFHRPLDGPSYTNAFIQKYIFRAVIFRHSRKSLPHIEKAGLVVTDIEILRLHYADTLRIWRERFMANREKAKAIYDERFCRMWEFYLAASEAAFRWQNLVVFQIQLAHRQEAVPLTRNYIEKEEKRLKRLECERSSANSQVETKNSRRAVTLFSDGSEASLPDLCRILTLDQGMTVR